MPKYAIVMTADSKFLPGVNAVLNSLKYYGWPDNLDFHLLYWNGDEMGKFIDNIKATVQYPNLQAIDLNDYLKFEQGRRKDEGNRNPPYYLKFYRSLYASRALDYDVVCLLDADRVLVNNILPYFDLAHQSKRIVMIDYKYNQELIENGYYKENPLLKTGACPFDPCFTLFSPQLYGKHFYEVHNYGKANGNSEMPNMNFMLITHGLLENIIRLPKVRWTARRWDKFTTKWLYNEDKSKFHMKIEGVPEENLLWYMDDENQFTVSKILGIDDLIKDNVSLMIAIHGKYWYRSKGEILKENRGKLSDEQIINNANIWEAYKFFNFDCYTHLETWKDNWMQYDMKPEGDSEEQANGIHAKKEDTVIIENPAEAEERSISLNVSYKEENEENQEVNDAIPKGILEENLSLLGAIDQKALELESNLDYFMKDSSESISIQSSNISHSPYMETCIKTQKLLNNLYDRLTRILSSLDIW